MLPYLHLRALAQAILEEAPGCQWGWASLTFLFLYIGKEL